MEIIKTEIDGVVIIEPRIFCDERGYFFESFSQLEFDEKYELLLNVWFGSSSLCSLCLKAENSFKFVS